MTSDARWSGLGDLGMAMSLGAMSGDWGQFGSAFAKGLNQAPKTYMSELDAYSKRNIENAKFEQETRRNDIESKMKEFQFKLADEKYTKDKNADAAMAEHYDAIMGEIEGAVKDLPDAEKNDAIGALASLKHAISIGDEEKVAKLYGDLMNLMPENKAQKLIDLQSIQEATSKGKTLGEAEGAMEGYNSIPAEQRSGYKWYNGVPVPMLPSELAKEQREIAESEARIKQIEAYTNRAEKEDADVRRAFTSQQILAYKNGIDAARAEWSAADATVKMYETKFAGSPGMLSVQNGYEPALKTRAEAAAKLAGYGFANPLNITDDLVMKKVQDQISVIENLFGARGVPGRGVPGGVGFGPTNAPSGGLSPAAVQDVIERARRYKPDIATKSPTQQVNLILQQFLSSPQGEPYRGDAQKQAVLRASLMAQLGVTPQ